jgi:foldase protein PrsA
MLKRLVPLVSMTLLAQSPAPPKPPMPMAHAMPPQPAATPEPKASDAIAYLGTRKLTYGDFASWLKVMVGPRAEMIRKTPASRAQALKQYLEIQVLAAKGQKENLQKTKQFQATLAALREQCYARVLLDEDRPGGDGQKLKEQSENPTEAEVKAYFQANSERFSTPERFTARHILVALKGAPGAGDKGYTDDEAKARLAKIQEELKSGKKLEDLTKEYSDDPGSKANGGLYKDIPFGRFAKEFEEAVRTQEIGKVGPPVKTSFGYHLILVEARSPRQEGDFEKVKDSIRKQMAPERREKLTKEYMDQTRKEVGFREVAEAQPAGAPQAAPKAP